MQCCCSGYKANCSVPERGCSAHAVEAVDHNAVAISFVGGCSANEGGCGEHAVVAVSPTVSLKVDAVPMLWMQCPTMYMQYVVKEDAVPMRVGAVIRQWLQCSLLCP